MRIGVVSCGSMHTYAGDVVVSVVTPTLSSTSAVMDYDAINPWLTHSAHATRTHTHARTHTHHVTHENAKLATALYGIEKRHTRYRQEKKQGRPGEGE